MQIVNTNQNTVIADAEIAQTFFSRMKGLLGQKTPKALIIRPCKQVHMFFMKFSIDVLFVDKNNRVIHIEENLEPFTISPFIQKASYVIELPAGTVELTGLGLNDELLYKKQLGIVKAKHEQQADLAK